MERVSLAGVLALLLPSAALAQRVEITPAVGLYAPQVEQLYFYHIVSSSTGFFVDSLRTAVDAGLSLGVTITARLGKLGLETSLLTTSTTRRHERGALTLPIPPSGSSTTIIDRLSVRSSIASARFAFHTPITRGLNGMIGVGPAWVWLSGEGYDQYGPSDRSIFGWSAGAKLGMQLGRRLNVDVAVADYSYQLDFGDPGAPPEIRQSARQHDLVATVGIAVPLR